MKFPRVHAAGGYGRGLGPYIPKGETPVELSELDDWSLSHIIDSYYVRVNHLWFGDDPYEGPHISTRLAMAAARVWRKRHGPNSYQNTSASDWWRRTGRYVMIILGDRSDGLTIQAQPWMLPRHLQPGESAEEIGALYQRQTIVTRGVWRVIDTETSAADR